MAFYITNGWDVAHHHINEGFKHLANSINANLSVSKTFKEVKNKSTWNKCLNLSEQIRAAFILENKEAIKATILFQAGMEAWINFAYTKQELKNPPDSFNDKWRDAFFKLNINYNFEKYAQFYTSQRNAIIHPSTQKKINTIAKINSIDTFEGIKHGWEAMKAIGQGLNQPFNSNSFDIICNTNGVKLTEIENLGNLILFEKELLVKHQEGLNLINQSL